MGFELARAAYARGANVIVIAGPTALSVPTGIDVVRVETTDDLAAALEQHLPEADLLLMAAAPADYRPSAPASDKRPRQEGSVTLTLEPTADVLERTRGARKAGALIVGFAYETDDALTHARTKLEKKGLDLVVLNVDGPETGAEVATNQVTLVTRDSQEQGPLEAKAAAARRILDAVEQRL